MTCREIRDLIKADIKEYIRLCNIYDYSLPKLVTVQVGDDEVSKKYINNKIKLCKEVGMLEEHIQLNGKVTDLMEILLDKKYNDESVNGVIIQLPATKEVEDMIFEMPKNKDVDGLGYESYKSYFFDKENSNIPCTVRGVLQILQCNNINVKGETVLVIGKGKTSGLPLSLMLQRLGATVINVNSNTTKENLHMLLNVANIVVSCAGTPILNYENMKHSTYKAVINVGMTTIDGKVVGDIDVNDLIEHKMDYESLITPILGGTGILTVVNLLLNTCIQHYFTVKHEYLKERLFIIIGKYL